ncbi:MAG: ABC transporter permease [Chloroflexota bacterium]
MASIFLRSQHPLKAPRRQTFAWGYWLSLPFLLFIAFPLMALVLRTAPLQWWQHLKDPQVLAALRLSLVTTLAAAFVIVLTGTPVAYLLAGARGRLARAIDALVDLPTVLPPAVAGVALLMAFGRRGLVGSLLNSLGIQIAFTPLAVVMAQVFIAAPFYIKAAVVGFSYVDVEIKQAAAIDGANDRQIFIYLIAPLSWRALLTGVVMSWARALGEFGATILFAGNFPGKTQTMPLAIYLGFETGLDTALTLSVILLLLSFVTLFAVKRLLGQSLDGESVA